MKSTSLSILLGLAFTFGAALSGRAEVQSTTRIPQGRGQFVAVAAAQPTSVALFVAGTARSESVAKKETRSVTVPNGRGSATLYR